MQAKPARKNRVKIVDALLWLVLNHHNICRDECSSESPRMPPTLHHPNKTRCVIPHAPDENRLVHRGARTLGPLEALRQLHSKGQTNV
jgi:hypothetical protein